MRTITKRLLPRSLLLGYLLLLILPAEPMAADRQRIGIFVLLFIVIFFVFASLLNREYWKDVH